jgi:small-conductance mechanosensitive channel
MEVLSKILLSTIHTKAFILQGIHIAIIIILSMTFYIGLILTVGRWIKNTCSTQVYAVSKKATFYIFTVVTLILSLNQLGFNLTSLLGAAGVFGIAIGFASQTSVSNIISGIFLLTEKPFEIGDVVEFESIVGNILSIDLLSVKILKFDNKVVRIPNESIIKNRIINFTKFPIRRMDIDIGVAYKESPDRIMKLLLEIANRNPLCLDEPAPMIMFKSFGESALEFHFGIWFLREDFGNLKNTIMTDIKNTFDKENIEIPFPHRTIYTGSTTSPFPINFQEQESGAMKTEKNSL